MSSEKHVYQIRFKGVRAQKENAHECGFHNEQAHRTCEAVTQNKRLCSTYPLTLIRGHPANEM